MQRNEFGDEYCRDEEWQVVHSAWREEVISSQSGDPAGSGQGVSTAVLSLGLFAKCYQDKFKKFNKRVWIRFAFYTDTCNR